MDNLSPILCHDGFRMKLDAFNWIGGVANSHDFMVINGMGGDFKAGRDGVSFSNEGVVACRAQGVLDAMEKGIFVMLDLTCLSMHQVLCADDVASKGMDDALAS
jgi:hypothetical protein